MIPRQQNNNFNPIEVATDSFEVKSSLRLMSHLSAVELQNIMSIIEKARAAFAYPNQGSFDQCPATIATVTRRLLLLIKESNCSAPKILLVGDDDLLSLAISASKLTQYITVVDVDRDLLNLINNNIPDLQKELVHADIRYPLNKHLIGKFDVVFTDPPYTMPGQLLFLRRAMQALSYAPGSSIYLSFGRLYLKQDEVDNIISFAQRGGMIVENIYEDFNEYIPPPDVVNDMKIALGDAEDRLFTSSLVHFKRLEPSPVPTIPELIKTKIYDYE